MVIGVPASASGRNEDTPGSNRSGPPTDKPSEGHGAAGGPETATLRRPDGATPFGLARGNDSKSFGISGAPRGIRTPNLLIRSQML